MRLNRALATSRATYRLGGVAVAGLTDLACRGQFGLDPIPDSDLQVEAKLIHPVDTLTGVYPTDRMQADVIGPDNRMLRYTVLRTPVVDAFNAILVVELKRA